jgi:RimJ/RimL family protein N-acetyltransferase
LGYLLKLWRDWEDFEWLIATAQSGDSMFWEMGQAGGVYMFTDITRGHRAKATIKVHKKEFMGEAALPLHVAMAGYIMKLFDLKRLEVRIPMDNQLSVNMCLKLGFIYEGTLRAYGKRGNLFNDVWVGSIVAPEEGP